MTETPIHIQLRKALLLECASGNFSAGQRFYSHRKICQLWNVSNTTAKSSVDWLVQQNIVEARPRSGYYLAPNMKRKARLLLHQQPSAHLQTPSPFSIRRFHLAAPNSKRIRKLGLVIYGKEPNRDILHSGSKNPALKSVWSRSFFEETVNRGWEFECFLNDGNLEQQELIVRRIREHRVDGVAIFMRTWGTSLHPMVQALLRANIPVVRVFGDSELTGAPMLNLNNVAMGYEAVRRFLRTGHSRIGALIEPRKCRDFDERIDGCRYGLEEFGKKKATMMVLRCSESRAVSTRIRRLFENPETRPTALFATRIELLRSLEPVLKGFDLKVPDDLSVIACGGVDYLPGMMKAVDVFRIDFHEVGRRAFGMLEELMEGRLQEKNQLIEVPYLKRGTVVRPH